MADPESLIADLQAEVERIQLMRDQLDAEVMEGRRVPAESMGLAGATLTGLLHRVVDDMSQGLPIRLAGATEYTSRPLVSDAVATAVTTIGTAVEQARTAIGSRIGVAVPRAKVVDGLDDIDELDISGMDTDELKAERLRQRARKYRARYELKQQAFPHTLTHVMDQVSRLVRRISVLLRWRVRHWRFDEHEAVEIQQVVDSTWRGICDDLAKAAPEAWSDLMRRPNFVSVSDWADQNRYLNSEQSAEPGRWRTSRVPYLREIMDTFTDPTVGRVTFLKSARVGGSEAMNNCLLYAAAVDPRPVLYVWPTEDAAKEEVTERLKLMFEDCKATAKHIVGKRWCTAKGIKLRSMSVKIGYATSPNTLIRRTCKYVFFDELDNCENQYSALGDVLTVAAERATTYMHTAKVMSATTPTVEGAAADREFKASDQRRYHVPCPHCGTYQVLKFKQIKVDQEHRKFPDKIEAEGLAWYECTGCSKKIHEADRETMVDRGVWVPREQSIKQTRPANAADGWRPQLECEKPQTRRVGFHINSLYSPWRTWSMCIAEFFRVKGDESTLRVFINSWLGETWKPKQESILPIELYSKRRRGTARGVCPTWAKRVTIGADCQKVGFYYCVRAWGVGCQSQLIAEGMVGDYEGLNELGAARWPVEGDGDKHLQASFIAIDSAGGRELETYKWADEWPDFVFPMKGQQNPDYRVRPSRVTYEGYSGKTDKYAVQLFHVNTTHYKNWLASAMKAGVNDYNWWGVYDDTPDDYFEQVTAEHRVFVQTKKGHVDHLEPIWMPRNDSVANHFLDCEVYQTAIADYLGFLDFGVGGQLGRPAPQPTRSKTVTRSGGVGRFKSVAKRPRRMR